MQSLKDQLIGALVGLARATDGNEHLISDDITATVRHCLTAAPASYYELQRCLLLVENAKQKMVPDCFHCANPCGRTNAYDIAALAQEPDKVRQIKLNMINKLCRLAAEEPNQASDKMLYRGLIVLGLDGYSPEELLDLFPISE